MGWHLNNLEWTHLWSLICILLICIQLLVINTYSRIPTHVVATSMFTQTSWQNTYHMITCVVSMNTSKLTRWQSTSHTITCAVATDKFSKYILYNHVTAIDMFKLTSWLNTSYIITCVVAINTFKLTSWLNASCIITCVVAINTFKLTSWLNTFSYYHPWQRTDQWNTTKLHGWVCNNLFIDLAVWHNTSNHITHSPTAWVQQPATRHPELLQQPHHTQPHSLTSQPEPFEAVTLQSKSWLVSWWPPGSATCLACRRAQRHEGTVCHSHTLSRLAPPGSESTRSGTVYRTYATHTFFNINLTCCTYTHYLITLST